MPVLHKANEGVRHKVEVVYGFLWNFRKECSVSHTPWTVVQTAVISHLLRARFVRDLTRVKVKDEEGDEASDGCSYKTQQLLYI